MHQPFYRAVWLFAEEPVFLEVPASLDDHPFFSLGFC
jgi:hypothetical protein